MGTQFVNANVYASIDTTATNCGINATDTTNNTFTYTERITGARISLSPVSAVLGPGATQQFTPTVLDSGGNPAPGQVTYTLTDSTLGDSVTAGGLYTAPAVIAADEIQQLVATFVPDGAKVSATIVLHP
jgi:hypothetical protein